MQYFCSCCICKINPGGGKWLSTKKTYKKHQEKEKACIEKFNESETESSSESISSYNHWSKSRLSGTYRVPDMCAIYVIYVYDI